MAEATVVTVTGGLVGIAIGYGAAEVVARFVETPPALSWVVFGLGFAFSALVGIVSGVSPARKAASLDPVEALR